MDNWRRKPLTTNENNGHSGERVGSLSASSLQILGTSHHQIKEWKIRSHDTPGTHDIPRLNFNVFCDCGLTLWLPHNDYSTSFLYVICQYFLKWCCSVNSRDPGQLLPIENGMGHWRREWGSKKEVDAFLEAVDRKFFAAAAVIGARPSIYYAALTPLSLDVYYLDTKIFLEWNPSWTKHLCFLTSTSKSSFP